MASSDFVGSSRVDRGRSAKMPSRSATGHRLKVSIARIDGSITLSITVKQTAHRSCWEANRWLTPIHVNGEDTYRAESFVSIYVVRHEGQPPPPAARPRTASSTGVWNYRGVSQSIFSQDNSSHWFLSRSWSRARATAFIGTTNRAAASKAIASPIYLYISSEVADAVDYYFFLRP